MPNTFAFHIQPCKTTHVTIQLMVVAGEGKRAKSSFTITEKEHKMTILIKTITLNEHKMSNPNITGEF